MLFHFHHAAQLEEVKGDEAGEGDVVQDEADKGEGVEQGILPGGAVGFQEGGEECPRHKDDQSQRQMEGEELADPAQHAAAFALQNGFEHGVIAQKEGVKEGRGFEGEENQGEDGGSQPQHPRVKALQLDDGNA